MKLFLLLFSIFCFLTGPCLADSLTLEIEADNADLLKILNAAVVLPAALKNSDPLNRRWLRHYQQQIPALVNSSLEPYGYFHSQTSSKIEQVSAEEYRLKLIITAGNPVIISSLHLALSGPGALLPELQQSLKSFPLKKGDILRQDVYEQEKSLLIQEAVDLGFLDADFSKHQINVYRAENRADITLNLETGVRYRFGRTTFSGNSNYPDRFLHRYLSYQEGDFFSQRKLGQTQLNFLNADLFQNVNVAPVSAQTEGNRKPVNIELRPMPKHRFRPGIGYGTDTGARSSLRYRDLNCFQSGHELKGDLLIAQYRQSLVTTYIIPDINRLDSQTQLRVGFDREESDSYLSRELFSEAEYQRAFGRNLLSSLFLRLTQEYSEVGTETNRSRMLLPGIRLQWRQVDNPAAPRYGFQWSVEAKGAQTALLSDTSLLQLTAHATNQIPLPHEFSLLLRLQGGTTWHNAPLRDLPASLRFFAGGDRSVRGYGFQALGPKDETGQVVGGKNLLVANLELEKRFTSKWGGVVFYDVGNAFDSFAEYELEQGAGIGIRRYTPIGPIRLDLARQIGNSTQRWRLHLSMGFGW